ncbi:uncharacterized protein EI90DRAFT_1764466 [Cantharellus anzutake]|uniref:uncharacterized protein n=1 Tax=Cantharellus anzutake TaxID=1750568 RepID=UPI00190305BA|nr:uncharacterized protein EI90DRAFT_1764466 [Cantharellus anzutake]KAF8327540.1 hypothetical protein EI90DRAFT_1764466 [Cantharellus anzutake]
MPVLPDDTYIIRNVRQKALVLAASMGTIAQCILESEITLPKGLPGDSKFQKEISIQYSPHSEGYKISVLDSFNHRPRVAFPSRIDGLSHEFMFFEEGHVFDDWRLTCHDGHKYSIGLRDGRVLSGKRGDSTWDLRKVAGITDLQKVNINR